MGVPRKCFSLCYYFICKTSALANVCLLGFQTYFVKNEEVLFGTSGTTMGAQLESKKRPQRVLLIDAVWRHRQICH